MEGILPFLKQVSPTRLQGFAFFFPPLMLPHFFPVAELFAFPISTESQMVTVNVWSGCGHWTTLTENGLQML